MGKKWEWSERKRGKKDTKETSNERKVKQESGSLVKAKISGPITKNKAIQTHLSLSEDKLELVLSLIAAPVVQRDRSYGKP